MSIVRITATFTQLWRAGKGHSTS